MRGERKREMKFDKRKCKKCKYHRKFPSGQFVFCNYASLTDQTCLKKVGKEIIDIRGDKYDRCKLFCEAKANLEEDMTSKPIPSMCARMERRCWANM